MEYPPSCGCRDGTDCERDRRKDERNRPTAHSHDSGRLDIAHSDPTADVDGQHGTSAHEPAERATEYVAPLTCGQRPQQSGTCCESEKPVR